MDVTEEMINRAARGDTRAFEAIYRAYAGMVFNLAYRFAGSWDDAQDITQNVFLSVHKNLKHFEIRSSIKTWIYRITVNTSLNHRRKWANAKHQHISFDETLDAGHDNHRAKSLQEEEWRQRVDQMLERLPPDQKACMILRHIEQLSYQDIAETLKININTVRSRLKRAREALIKMRREVIQHDM